MIKCQLPALIGQWETNHGKPLTFTELAKETGKNEKALRNLAYNRTKRYDSGTLMALCEFFDCQVGDILVYEQE